MNNQKVEQVLKEIFDHYGTDIVRSNSKFKSAVFDLLNDWEYKEERIVLGYAIDSGILWTLVSADSAMGEVAGKVTNQLREKAHMTEEDAKFVVGCFLAVCGKNVAPGPENAGGGNAGTIVREEANQKITHEPEVHVMENKPGMQANSNHVTVTVNRTSGEEDNGGFLWGLVGCCVPVAGLVLYLVWKDSKPKTAKTAGIGALVGVIAIVVMYVFLAVFSILFASL